MKPLSMLGLLACAAALGAQLVGRGILLPELGAGCSLVDANLATTLRQPLHLRLAETVLAAHLLVAGSASRWIGARWATSAGLVLVGLSGLQRFVVLPAMYEAWSRADLVASRPIEQVLLGDRLHWQDGLLVGVMALLQLALLGAAARMMKPPAATSACDPAPAPPGC